MSGQQTATPEGGAYIPSSVIYAEVVALGRQVAPLVGAIPDHERRLRGLEQRLWLAVGGGTVIGTVLGALLQPVLGTLISS